MPYPKDRPEVQAKHDTTHHFKYKALGLCVQCGKKHDGKQTTCKQCRIRYNKWQNALNKECRAKGICVACHKQKAIEGSQCTKCGERGVELYRNKVASKGHRVKIDIDPRMYLELRDNAKAKGMTFNAMTELRLSRVPMLLDKEN